MGTEPDDNDVHDLLHRRKEEEDEDHFARAGLMSPKHELRLLVGATEVIFPDNSR